MKSLKWMTVGLGLVAAMLLAMAPCGAVAPEGAARPPAADAKAVAEANNTFAADLYAKLAAKEGNLFFSPNSIETALVMTYAGARGKTAGQMAAVLHIGAGDEWVPSGFGVGHSAFGAFLKDLNAEKGPDGKPRGYQLSVANALWGQKGYAFLPAFLNLVKTNYGAGLSEVDFVKDAEGARKTINAWVEKETRDKIKDLIQPNVLRDDTRLVLTNAIYFKSNWASEYFRKEHTKDEPFSTAPDKKITAPMMHAWGHFPYAASDAFQAVKIAYKGYDLAMIVLLPKKVDGLAALEKSLTPDLVKGLKWTQNDMVDLSLPKFKMTEAFELAPTLAAMGMAEAFSVTAADFSGMTGKRELFISNVIHKAFVDVNEEGTEAAAATAVVIARMSAPAEPEPPVVFKADHPFLFLIRHEKSGAILFMGRLADPTK